jgi:broad specificity phosphatase PhoE
MTESDLGRVLLVRHGESEGNRTRTFTHSPSVSLTDLGREQAARVAQYVGKHFRPTRVVTSPYARASETARIIAVHLGLPLEVDDAWREQSLGRLAGESYEMARRDPTFDPSQPWVWRPPSGESLIDVQARVIGPFEERVRENPVTDIVIVCHARVIQAISAHVTGSWQSSLVAPNGGIVVIEHRAGRCETPRLVLPA